MKLRLAILLALLPALPAGSQTETVVSPSEFRAYAEGYTLYFEEDGEPAGAESFGKDGEVTWQSLDGACIHGLWRPYEDELCFYYGLETGVQCWSVLRDEQGLKVRLNDPLQESLTYRITRRDRTPLLCGSPSFQTRARPAPDGPFSPPAPPRSRS